MIENSDFEVIEMFRKAANPEFSLLDNEPFDHEGETIGYEEEVKRNGELYEAIAQKATKEMMDLRNVLNI